MPPSFSINKLIFSHSQCDYKKGWGKLCGVSAAGMLPSSAYGFIIGFVAKVHS
jgi:hypothetical protein